MLEVMSGSSSVGSPGPSTPTKQLQHELPIANEAAIPAGTNFANVYSLSPLAVANEREVKALFGDIDKNPPDFVVTVGRASFLT